MSIRQGDYLIAGAGGGGAGDIDNKSITNNASNKIQTVGVIDQNNVTNAIKSWSGTKLQYDALVNAGTIDNNTLYYITDDNGSTNQPDRNIGEIVTSTIPLTDAGLHLLDGSLISGDGVYSSFVDYIGDLYGDGTNIPDFFMKDGQDIAWTQPILSANGTIGGDDFAVSASSEFSSEYAAWKAFDGVAGSDFATNGNSLPCYIEFYNPIPLKVTSLSITNRQGSGSVESFTGGSVYGSNNGTDWTPLTTYTNNNTTGLATWTINLNTNTNYYKYYKIEATSVSGTNNGFSNIAITAVYLDISVTAEDKWQSAVSTYGVCGKFVYDSVNNTVRLPKYNSKIYSGGGVANAKGNGITLGMTDGTNNLGLGGNDNTNPFTLGYGNYYGEAVGTTGSGSFATTSRVSYGITTDETKSGIITDLSTITTSLDGYWYIVVATSTKTQIEVDIDEIATDLNGKADVDLSNINASQSAKDTIISWSMPDYSAKISASFPYTAPSDGYCYIGATDKTFNLYIDGVEVHYQVDYAAGLNSQTTFIPICKGQQITTTDNNVGLAFIPLKGV